jgi:hypothetical protein
MQKVLSGGFFNKLYVVVVVVVVGGGGGGVATCISISMIINSISY